MQLQTLPRTYVKALLGVARLPLTAVERLAGRADDATWPPSLGFDAFAASARQVSGSLLRDEELVRQGRLGQARVAELRDVTRLETVAEETRAEADNTFRARRESAEQRKQEATQRAAQRETAAERRRQEAAKKAEADAQRKEQKAAEAERSRMEALEKKDRATRGATIAKERTAISRERAAANAKAKVVATDKKLRATKAARRSA